MLVHCRDARDMGRHYPLICYPANGWELRKDRTRTITCRANAQETIEVSEYEFRKRRSASWQTKWVVNVLLLPDGTTTSDISAVMAAAADYRTHFFGAGQIQLVFPDGIDPPDRQRISETFMDAVGPAIEAIGSGIER